LEQEQATNFALWRGIALVIVPGLIFVVGLIALVMPSRPPVSILNGCYRVNSSPRIRISSGVLSVYDAGIGPIQMSVQIGKDGYMINAATGFSFLTDQHGTMHAVRDYPLGELIPAYVWGNQPPSLGLILDGNLIKIPKIACPSG
jgi:hypothetical protein